MQRLELGVDDGELHQPIGELGMDEGFPATHRGIKLVGDDTQSLSHREHLTPIDILLLEFDYYAPSHFTIAAIFCKVPHCRLLVFKVFFHHSRNPVPCQGSLGHPNWNLQTDNCKPCCHR